MENNNSSESQGRQVAREYGAYLNVIWDKEEQQKREEQELAFLMEEMDQDKFIERQREDMEMIANELDVSEQRSVSNACGGNARRNKLWNGLVN